MATLAKHLILCSSTTTSSSGSPSPSNRRRPPSSPEGADMRANVPQSATRRLAVAASTAMVATAALSARRPAAPPPALAAEAAAVPTPAPPGTVPRWGTRSYVRERFFEPGLTSEEAAARIRQTAEGMRTLRPMLETMSWKYVLFYVRLKSKYLDLDLTTAMAGVPELRRPDYVRVANELVDNMTEVGLTCGPHVLTGGPHVAKHGQPASTTRRPSSRWMMWQSSLHDRIYSVCRSRNVLLS